MEVAKNYLLLQCFEFGKVYFTLYEVAPIYKGPMTQATLQYSIIFLFFLSYILILFQLEEHESKNPLGVKNVSLNEFKRETNFHRQAQAAVLEGLARLKAIGVVTKRPEDYFAEMAKSDSHMQKVVMQYFLIVCMLWQ